MVPVHAASMLTSFIHLQERLDANQKANLNLIFSSVFVSFILLLPLALLLSPHRTR
jgi:predicted membrane protein